MSSDLTRKERYRLEQYERLERARDEARERRWERRIDISAELEALIAKIDDSVDYAKVREVRVTPGEASVVFYLSNDEGKIEIDSRFRSAVMSSIQVEVKT